MSENRAGTNVFSWISHVSRKGANIVIAGEHGSGKTYLLEGIMKDVIVDAPQDKIFLSLKKFPVLNIKDTLSIATAPIRNNDSPIEALRREQDRLVLDEATDGETLENTFLFHDMSACEGRLGQYIITLEADGKVEDRVNELSFGMSGEDVRNEFLETIDFVIYMNPASDRAQDYPEGIKSISEVIIDAAGKLGERTIWEYSDSDDSVFLQTGTPSRRRREKFFWC
jgi:type IV secretory pathway ATPase VirB11/archaellum biosynthesis ATPase